MNEIDFDKGNGLVPAVVQDVNTRKVLMLGYMNREAYKHTLNSRKVTFWSRSRNERWTKGDTSGNYLELISMHLDCDQDALLVKAIPTGPVCHKGWDTCWNETNEGIGFLNQLEDIVDDRLKRDPEESYTARLASKGIHKVAQKVGEEGVEVVIEALRDDKERLCEESADLIFHLIVTLRMKGLSLKDVSAVLEKRHQQD